MNDQTNIESNTQENTAQEEKEKKKFLAGRFLFSVIQKEYEYEANRFSNLQSRTGILLTFDIAFLAYLSSTAKFPDLNNIKVSNVAEASPYFMIILLYLIPFVLILISISYFLKVFSIDSFGRLSLDGFNESYAILKEDVMAVSIMNEYREIIEHNTKVIDKKVDYYTYGIYSIVCSFIVNAILYIASFFLKTI